MEELHDLSDGLHSLSMIHYSICWQQSRLQWLWEGDDNSKKFHGTMANRRGDDNNCNNISILEVGAIPVEGVANIRVAVFNHFSNHFKAPVVVSPRCFGFKFPENFYY